MTGKGSLAGKRIVLAITGSIAAVETVRLAHELRRKGCDVTAVVSSAAAGIVHPDALTYATGNRAITAITGEVEHVRYCGEGGAGDLLLVAPCTANTICKMAHGIDDTPVTTFATTAIGRGMPIVVAPAMHETMYRHPAIRECLERLAGWGVVVLAPRIEEGKAKVAGIDEIVLSCERELMGKPLAGKHVLVSSGPCREPVDDVRLLTTGSTGRMGRELAMQAYRLGADVTVVHAASLPLVANVPIVTAGEMYREVVRICRDDRPDLYISAAAISDFAPDRFDGKLASGKEVSLTLRPQPKLIDEVMRTFGVPVIGFKLGRSQEQAARLLLERGARMVIVNGPDTLGSDRAEITILTRDAAKPAGGTKRELAVMIWDEILMCFPDQGS